MSDIPQKTYPPEFLKALMSDHEAERAGATPEESAAVDTREDAMGEDLVNLAKRWPDRVATHYDGCEATHVGCLVKKLAREVERLTTERDKALADGRLIVAANRAAKAERARCIRAIQRMPVPIDQVEGARRAIAALEALEDTP